MEAEEGLEGGSAVVRFFCPCNRNIVLPPSARHSYFEIMNWCVVGSLCHGEEGVYLMTVCMCQHIII